MFVLVWTKIFFSLEISIHTIPMHKGGLLTPFFHPFEIKSLLVREVSFRFTCKTRGPRTDQHPPSLHPAKGKEKRWIPKKTWEGTKKEEASVYIRGNNTVRATKDVPTGTAQVRDILEARKKGRKQEGREIAQ
jgi:hypothetical protein